MTALAPPVRSGRSLYLLAVPVALLGLAPVGFIVAESVGLGWADLRVAVLRPRVAELLGNTLTLSVLCVLGCLVIGLGTAWLVERSDLPGRRVWAALLVTPLAVPAFVNSYAWASLRPSFEGLSAAATITVLSYYPFVYLPVAAALRGLERVLEESGAALGLGKLAVFVRVILPQLRVALLGGALLVALHIFAEFGALQMIGYETFTTVILVQYQSTFNGSTATTLAGVLVMCCLLFLTLEVLARGRVRYARVGPGAAVPVPPVRLGNLRWPSVIVVVALLVAAVGVPVFAIVQWWSSDVAVGAELMPAPAVLFWRLRALFSLRAYARLAMNRPSHRRKVSSAPSPFGSIALFTSGIASASIERRKACMLASWRAAQLLNSICL